MAAVASASPVTDVQPSEPHLRLFLPIIVPWEVERKFWTSPVFLSATRDIDALHLLMRISENFLFLFRTLADVPDSVIFQIRGQCKRNFTLTLLHVALKLIVPATYFDWRWGLVSHMRLYNLLGTLAIFQYVRAILGANLHVGYVEHVLLYQVVRGNPAFMTARAFFMCSACVLPFLQALPPVLPFVAELLVQLVYLFFGTQYHAPLTADVLSAPKYTDGVQQLCDALSHAMPTPQALRPRIICGVQRAWVLALFYQLFVGCILPLYVCYTLECRLKLRFLRQLRAADTPTSRQQQAPLPHAATAPAAQPQQLQQPQQQPGIRAHPHRHLRPTRSPWHSPITTQLSRMKRQFKAALKAPSLQPTPTVRAASPPSTARYLLQLLYSCMFHAAALYLLAALSWQAVVALQVPLARRSKSMSFQDGYKEWYWELVCGTDQPCCPA